MLTKQSVADHMLETAMEEISVKEGNDPIATYVNTRTNGTVTQVTLSTPDGEASPRQVVFVLDISGSMETEVSVGSESDGFSLLDVVKHAIRTCLEGLRPQDRASVVVYSTYARILVPLRRMDAPGKASIESALARLTPELSTNIWDGLKLGIEQLPKGGTIFLLTDGQPNQRPPRGEVQELRKALYDRDDDIVLSTFGFGYNLDTPLLIELARVTQGSYSFIPDIGLVGTVFVHAMANLQTSADEHLALAIETEGIVSDLPELEKTSWGYFLPVGRITKGQDRDIFIECDQPVTISVAGKEATSLSEHPGPKDRQVVALGIRKLLEIARMGDFERVNSVLNKMMASVQDPQLREDLNGQVREAIVPEAYRKWGRHYLPSLAFAHWTQQCNNFLDKGIQDYGGTIFQTTRDALDDAFNRLPAPKPSKRKALERRCRVKGKKVRALPARMSAYNKRDNQCFAGHCRVEMADKSLKACRDIRADDVVATSTGAARVVCVLKTSCKSNIAKLVLYGKLLVTPWHPIMVEGRWTFPNDVGEAKESHCDAVYSFLLEAGFQDMRIEDTLCITLAHGIKHNIVAAHPFYGTQKVVDAMMQDNSGFSNGLVEVQGVKRDTKTDRVNGFQFRTSKNDSNYEHCMMLDQKHVDCY